MAQPLPWPAHAAVFQGRAGLQASGAQTDGVVMAAHSSTHAPGSPPDSPNMVSTFLRTFWLAIGNFALLVCAVVAARRDAPSHLDALYACIVVMMIGVRFLDISRFDGRTIDGGPASMKHWWLYVFALVPVAAGLWLLVRLAVARGWL